MGFEVLIDNKSIDNHIVYHEACNKSLNGQHVSHEWIFMNNLYKAEIKKDSSIAQKFMMFVVQFYPHYRWLKFDLDDPIASVVLECYICSFNLEHKDIVSEATRDEALKAAMEFGNIVTEFLIRFLNYSLIDCQGQKIIITAHSNCDKRFADLLIEGYSLRRLAKITYTEVDDNMYKSFPKVSGFFRLLPVLPTKDMGFEIEEIIETEDGRYEKII